MRRSASSTAVVHAIKDPEVVVQAFTPSSSNFPLDKYLQDHLVAAADAFDVVADDLDSAFREANDEWLANPVEIGVAVRPSETHVDAGQTVPIIVELSRSKQGRR